VRIVCVAGLPGSGKTTLLAARAKEGARVVDDIVDPSQLPETFEGLLVVSDVSFCIARTRTAAEIELRRRYPYAEVSWMFFENDPDACRANVEARSDGRDVEADISVLSRRYSIPEGAEVFQVHRAPAAEVGIDDDQNLGPEGCSPFG
jgi:predicted ATPase